MLEAAPTSVTCFKLDTGKLTWEFDVKTTHFNYHERDQRHVLAPGEVQLSSCTPDSNKS